MEAGNVLKQKVRTGEVVVEISSTEEISKLKEESSPLEVAIPPSGISSLSPLPSQTPKTPPATGFRQRPIGRSLRSKSKSRLVEPPYPRKTKVVEETSDQNQPATGSSPYPYGSSPYNGTRAGGVGKESKRARTPGSITPKTPLMASPGGVDGEEDEDDDEVYMTARNSRVEIEVKKHGKNVNLLILIEWIVLFSIVGVLIASLCINKLKNQYVWGLHIWRWCVLILTVFCGHLVTGWFMDVLVFFIEKNFLLKKKVLYFLYALRKSVRVSVWLGLILLTWALLINRGVKRSRRTIRILNYITRGIASSLIGALLWMVKTFLVKLLASSFHVKTFFDRIQDSIFHQYVLQTLSYPPLLKHGESSTSSGRLSFKHLKKSGKQGGLAEEVIDVDKLYKMKKEKISAWTMGGLIKVIMTSGLSTISELLDESEDNEGAEQKEIKSEFEAKAAAKRIFKKVAKSGKG